MALNFANNNSLSAITAKPSGLAGGGLNLISTQTASNSSTLDFTSGIDSTYKEYVFKCISIHPATNQTNLTFQADTGTNTSYNQTVTSTYFRAAQVEDGSGTGVSYDNGRDQAQGSSFIEVLSGLSSDNDSGSVGTIHLFNPSSDTFVKHFIAVSNQHHTNGSANVSRNQYIAGYFNTTTALTRVQFKMSSGNFDGVIKLYGIS